MGIGLDKDVTRLMKARAADLMNQDQEALFERDLPDLRAVTGALQASLALASQDIRAHKRKRAVISTKASPGATEQTADTRPG